MAAWLKNLFRQSAVPPVREAPTPSAENRRKTAEAFKNQGNAHYAKGELEQAAARYRLAVESDPDYADAYNNLGAVCRAQNRNDEALECYRKAVGLNPALAKAHYNLGSILAEKGDYTAAANAYKQAIAAHPGYAGAHDALGVLLEGCAKFDEAIVHFRRAVALDPQLATAHNNLGSAYQSTCRLDEAIACFRRALLIEPDAPIPRQNLLLALNYSADCSAEALFREHLKFAEIHADVLAAAAHDHPNERDPARRLRLGYVSPDFRRHSVSYFFEPLLINHDSSQFEIYCYSNSPIVDDVTQRLKARADHWRTIAGMSEEDAAEVVRRDKIDILIDLAGHTARNSLLVFARKPAPVQMTWLGYPNTTGLPTMDYRITDVHAEPEGLTDHLYTEKLYRLPEVFCGYLPKEGSPEPAMDAPLFRNGYATFGSLNNFAKVTPPVIELWSRILNALPDSRLLLESPGLGAPDFRQSIFRQFKQWGIGEERLEVLERDTSKQYWMYHRIDICLDPFPCNGGTTSCDALWMGTPLVTLAGKTFVSRMGVSLLENTGLDELIAQTPDEYVAIATRLATDLDYLREMRRDLRAKVADSPLMDMVGFTRRMETAYRETWRSWCGGDAS